MKLSAGVVDLIIMWHIVSTTKSPNIWVKGRWFYKNLVLQYIYNIYTYGGYTVQRPIKVSKLFLTIFVFDGYASFKSLNLFPFI